MPDRLRRNGAQAEPQIAIGWTIATVVLGVVLAVQVPLLRGQFHAAPAVVGLLLGLDALGLVLGSLVAGSRRFGRAAYPLALGGMGAAIMIAFILGTTPVFFGLAYVATRLGEALQLGIDLPVAGGPEVARGYVSQLFDVVARVGPEVENAEDDVRGRAEVHIAPRYITTMYLVSISMRNLNLAALTLTLSRCAGEGTFYLSLLVSPIAA